MSNNQPALDQYIIECEQEILTSIITTPFVVDECILALLPDDFIDPKHRAIYAAIKELHDTPKPVNKNIILDYIANNANFQFENWKEYFDKLAAGFSFADDLKTNIEIVKNASIKRNLDAFANKVIETKIDFAKYSNQIFELEKEFMDIIQAKKTSHVAEMSEVARGYRDNVQKLRERKVNVTGTPVGFPTLDRTTNGFQPGDLIILAARPGVGKTAISLNFVNNAAKEIKRNGTADKDKVVVFSLEMGKEQLCQRLVAMESSVTSNSLRTGQMSDYEWESVKTALDGLESMPILIDDTSDMSIIDVQSKLKQLKNKYNIKLVIVDYIQLLKGPRVKGQQVNRQQEVSTISRMLKLLAREVGAPIIALAQLSRDIEKRGGEPMLSDLRESGSLEQDADLVTFLHQEKEASEEAEDGKVKAAIVHKPRPDILKVKYIIAKHRNGELRTINMIMTTRYGTFQELESKTEKGE